MTKFTRFKMLLMALVLLVGSGNVVGQILTFEFSALAGSEVSASSNYNDANLTASSITRGAGLTASANAQRFNATNWALTSIANAVSGNNYMQITITPNSGYQFTVSSIYIQLQRSNTGPSAVALRSSVDNYATNLDQIYAITDNTTTQNFTFTFSQSASSTPVTYRFYMYAEATSGSGGIGDGTGNDIVVSGVVSATAGNPVASTPTFSPDAGTFYSAQNVTLSSATDGSTIYYTTDGSDPDNTDTQYSTPIAVSSTTTIKAIAYKDGMDPSGIGSAIYTFPTINSVSNITALRGGATDGTVYKLTGEAILTLKTSANSNTKYIQDATGGIMIYDSGSKITTTYNVGDGITNLTGTLTSYNGMLEFVPVIDAGAATSTGNTVTPVEIDLANMANYPGQLVKVSGVTIDGTGNFAASTVYNLNSSSTTVLRSAYIDLPWIGSAIPTVPQDIIGVVLINSPAAQLIPRTISDFSNTVFSSPTIIVSEATVPEMTAQVGATDTETITVNAQNLTENISLAVTGTDASLFTLSTNSIAPTSGTVTDQSVTITYTPLAAGSHTATLTLSSAGATDVVKTLSGSATWPPLDAPVATDASGINQGGFTANWNAVSGATSYELSVYTKQESTVNASDLFISEYVEGSSSNKYIEIYNGTGSSVDLSDYKLELYPNGGSVNPSVTLSGTLANGTTKVYKNSSAVLTLPGGVIADANGAVNFNGDDAIALYKISTSSYVDIFGRIGDDPGTAWTADGGYTTVDKTLRRKSSVISGITINPTGTGPTAFTTLATEWDLFSTDVVTDLGSHTFAGGGTSSTPISGSPFTVTGETTKALTGLTASTTYYYTVVAKNANVDSNASNEISVITSIGTGVETPALKNITAYDGKIHFSASAGQQVEVYNAVGQKLMSTTTLDGLNTLSVNAKGMMIVKVGDRLAKVIL